VLGLRLVLASGGSWLGCGLWAGFWGALATWVWVLSPWVAEQPTSVCNSGVNT